MTEQIQGLLQKAQNSIQAAMLLYRENYYDFAASRGYYAMFYTAEALLLSKELSFSSHSAVLAAFGREFAKSGIINTKFHRYLLDAEDLRHSGDYDINPPIAADQVLNILAWAEEFLQVAKQHLA
ncbi:MAG: HEPN domain-containing protein [Chloroflexi bacterium]|nr:HEPN domain-containing protein [Chloroflexota bacterium]